MARHSARGQLLDGDVSLRPCSRTTHGVVRTRASRICCLWSSLLALVAAGPVQAAPEPPVVAFDRFIAEGNPVCQSQHAAQCVEFAWHFADADRDGGLSLDELAALRADLEVWAIWRQADLAADERSGIALGLWLVDSIGLEYLHSAYDADRDGRISRSELLADVRLDERPIGSVLLDPAAVDHAGIARRLGLPPTILERLPLDRAE
jgi:hypothetical protein